MGNCCGSPKDASGEADTPARPRYDAERRAVGGNQAQGPSGNAREAAAIAAEERAAKATAASNKGKLSQNLAQQKKQTRTGALEAASQEERLQREADTNTRALYQS